MAYLPGLDVVIVTYASRDLISICLKSLFGFRPAYPMHVFLADNDSPDDTVAVVTSLFPSVDVVARPANDGFAVANNSLIKRGHSAYVLVLNPDTRLEPGVLDHLVAEMEADTSIGMLGCRLLTADGTFDHAAKRTIPTPASALKYFALRTVGRRGSEYVRPEVSETDIADVDAINGAFMLIRREAIDQVGLLDERYWMYAEDLDWCLRFTNSGWRVVYDGSVTANHLKAGSTGGRRPPRLNYHFHRSMAVFYLAHQSTSALMDALVLTGIWLRFGATTTAGLLHHARAIRLQGERNRR